MWEENSLSRDRIARDVKQRVRMRTTKKETSTNAFCARKTHRVNKHSKSIVLGTILPFTRTKKTHFKHFYCSEHSCLHWWFEQKTTSENVLLVFVSSGWRLNVKGIKTFSLEMCLSMNDKLLTTAPTVRGRNEGGQGGIISRLPNDYWSAESLRWAPNDCWGCWKVPTMSQVLSSIQ